MNLDDKGSALKLPLGVIRLIRNFNIGEENGYEGFRKDEGLRA